MRTTIQVDSPDLRYTDSYIEANYTYETTYAQRHGNTVKVLPLKQEMKIRTEKKVPKVGVMLVGWGGNNGTTITAAVLANKLGLFWHTKDGKQCANYFGSLTQSSTVSLSQDVHVPLGHMLPMVDPDDIVFGGWDISKENMAAAMERARVLDYALQKQLQPHMEKLKPLPSVYNPDFIAANQSDRADNLIEGTKWQQIQRIRKDIRDFKSKQSVDKVIVLWTANTERYCRVAPGLNDTSDNLMASIKNDASEVSPSTLFAVASILEGCAYINGSPQNTFVPGCIELAEQHQVFIAGDDFKSGQTKLKSVLVDFLVSAGIKPRSIVSYNHLGNNDGKNLSAPQQFQSKEISKSNVVDDMVKSNNVLYKKGEKPDHTVVIKYVPHVGDSKRAMDEYCSEIMCGGSNTIIIHNTCEDSLLAAPIILDLVILAELCQRIRFQAEGSTEWESFHPVLSILSYLVKAPLVPPQAPVVNALFSQRLAIENLMRACLSLPPNSHMNLEHRVKSSGGLKRSLELQSEIIPSKKANDQLFNGSFTNGEYTNGVANGNNLVCHR